MVENIPGKGNSQCKVSNECECLAFLRLSEEANIVTAKCVKREVRVYEAREFREGHIMWGFVGHSRISDFILSEVGIYYSVLSRRMAWHLTYMLC